MFGAIYLLYNLIGGAISGTKGFIENEQAKNRGYQRQLEGKNNVVLYVDRKGVTRLLSTNEFANIKYDYVTGDAWLCIGAPSKRVRNLSQEWRDDYYERIKNNPIPGKTVIEDKEIRYNVSKNTADIAHELDPAAPMWSNTFYAYGQWYKDIKTGHLYCARRYKGHDFYMDILSGEFVRITDEWCETLKKNNIYNKYDIDEIIKTFNLDRKGYNGKPKNDDLSYKWEYWFLDNHIVGRGRSVEREMMGQVAPRFN